MSSTPSSSRQRFLVRAGYYSFFTPLVVLLLLLIFTGDGGRNVMRICGLVSLGVCVTSCLAGLTSMCRSFHCVIDRFSVLALVGIAISLGVGVASYYVYLFSNFPSC